MSHADLVEFDEDWRRAIADVWVGLVFGTTGIREWRRPGDEIEDASVVVVGAAGRHLEAGGGMPTLGFELALDYSLAGGRGPGLGLLQAGGDLNYALVPGVHWCSG